MTPLEILESVTTKWKLPPELQWCLVVEPKAPQKLALVLMDHKTHQEAICCVDLSIPYKDVLIRAEYAIRAVLETRIQLATDIAKAIGVNLQYYPGIYDPGLTSHG